MSGIGVHHPVANLLLFGAADVPAVLKGFEQAITSADLAGRLLPGLWLSLSWWFLSPRISKATPGTLIALLVGALARILLKPIRHPDH